MIRSIGLTDAGSIGLPDGGVGPRLRQPASATVEAHLVGLLREESPEFEQYLVLRQAIERAHSASGVAVVAVTSAGVGDGKTTTAINLAGALARNPCSRVLLVDADLRIPSVAARIGVANVYQRGLVDLILDAQLALTEVVCRPQPGNLSVLTAGAPRHASPYELLHSRRFGDILAGARRFYDFIIIDTPPVIPVPDCRAIETVVDGFLIVVAAHQTPQRLLEESLTVLGPEKSLGLVFNLADRPFRGYYRSYYNYGYGKPDQAGPRG